MQLTSVDDPRVCVHRWQPARSTWRADAVHVLACDGSQVTPQYAALQDWWHADSSIFSGRVFYKPPKKGRTRCSRSAVNWSAASSRQRRR